MIGEGRYWGGYHSPIGSRSELRLRIGLRRCHRAGGRSGVAPFLGSARAVA